MSTKTRTRKPKARPTLDVTVEQIEEAIGMAFNRWARQCHAVSIAIVKSGVVGKPCRVARGSCKGVWGQHSWVVLGMDCYDMKATILDPTLWSYVDGTEPLWVGTLSDGLHHPHGQGTIWEYGRPGPPEGPVIELKPKTPLSREAERFLAMAAPGGLDRRGWSILANAPVELWPAGEIIAAMDDTPDLRALVPIDRLGMLTDRNPSGLYLP